MRLLVPMWFLAGCEVVGGPVVPVDLPPLTASGWQVSDHPCVGNRTDALLVDDGQLYAGCGTTAEGTGLFESSDGGVSWSEVGGLEAFRVSSLQASGGTVYVGGIDTQDSDRVLGLKGGALEPVFVTTGHVFDSFHVGTFRRQPNGRAFAESLTGTGIVWRDDDGADWQDGAGWGPGSDPQILDLEIHAGELYGCGDRITEPPKIYLPASGGGVALEVVEVASFGGELWDLDVDAGGIVAGGVNQDDAVGVVFWAGHDEDFARFDVPDDEATWIHGVCRGAGRMVAVGSYSRRSGGILWFSDDAGDTWTEAAPPDSPDLHRCDVDASGSVTVAGADGFVAWQ